MSLFDDIPRKAALIRTGISEGLLTQQSALAQIDVKILALEDALARMRRLRDLVQA